MTSSLPGFEPYHRCDLFEPGDRTALVCLDVPEMQRLVIEQLGELDHKIHTGLFLDDSILKLRSHTYDVVVVSEHFNGSTLENHPILTEAATCAAAQRRRQVYVLIGSSLTTNDEMQAFGFGVDLVISLADMMNLKPVLRRGVGRAREFYAPLNEVVASLAGSPAR
jgi:hypothetical protein